MAKQDLKPNTSIEEQGEDIFLPDLTVGVTREGKELGQEPDPEPDSEPEEESEEEEPESESEETPPPSWLKPLLEEVTGGKEEPEPEPEPEEEVTAEAISKRFGGVDWDKLSNAEVVEVMGLMAKKLAEGAAGRAQERVGAQLAQLQVEMAKQRYKDFEKFRPAMAKLAKRYVGLGVDELYELAKFRAGYKRDEEVEEEEEKKKPPKKRLGGSPPGGRKVGESKGKEKDGLLEVRQAAALAFEHLSKGRA